MGVSLVSVPALHQSLLCQRPCIGSSTWLHGSTTPIRYPSKLTTIPHCSSSSSSSSTSVVEESPPPAPDALPVQSEAATDDTGKLPPRGCQACGREEMEKGCNGEGRIQGGIATVPGFGWWPIKAYRPCPAFLASGGRYRRRGQSMDEVASGGSNTRQRSKEI
ncbi:uncharacterized protein LOC132176121 [Corylus avellana]|uniref:uncharacterized protein LOC132176121 n=1 Tax=Corylus avellana TaxID=13451 RepID=UPI00286B5EFC|nr:uncharacterized protein LOC132176121 [Corylus avellana]